MKIKPIVKKVPQAVEVDTMTQSEDDGPDYGSEKAVEIPRPGFDRQQSEDVSR